MYLRWILESLALYGLSAVICLFIIGQFASLFSMPEFLRDFSNAISIISEEHQRSNLFHRMLRGVAMSVVPILVFGYPLVTLYMTYKQHRDNDYRIGRNTFNEKRNLDYLMPINSKERIFTFFLSINAGFSEEIYFRLLIPTLLYIITGSVFIAIMGSTIWFGLMHYYQGIGGMMATFVVGLLLFLVYLITRSIWMAILTHIIIDLNGLVLAPWFADWLNRTQHET